MSSKLVSNLIHHIVELFQTLTMYLCLKNYSEVVHSLASWKASLSTQVISLVMLGIHCKMMLNNVYLLVFLLSLFLEEMAANRVTRGKLFGAVRSTVDSGQPVMCAAGIIHSRILSQQ